MSRAPGKYVAGTMAPAGAALDRPGLGGSNEGSGRKARSSYLTLARYSLNKLAGPDLSGNRTLLEQSAASHSAD
jgi:hypothetical protein